MHFSGCIIDINRHLSEPSPLLINPTTRNFIRTADTRGNIRLAVNEPLLLACSGLNNFLTVRGAGAHERTATCVSGQTFRVDNINYHINQLVCVNVSNLNCFFVYFFHGADELIFGCLVASVSTKNQWHLFTKQNACGHWF